MDRSTAVQGGVTVQEPESGGGEEIENPEYPGV